METNAQNASGMDDVRDGAMIAGREPKPGTALADAYWPDVEAGERGVLILPLGSLEQHGPHLPLDTDTALARRVAAEVHRRRPGSGLAPAMPFGSSGEHADFPGTLSIGTEALCLVLVELIRDAARWWSGMLIVNGHGGNLDALRRAEEISRRETRDVAVAHMAVTGMDAHAGHSETSLMAHLHPDRVRRGQVRAGRIEPVSQLLDEIRRTGVRAVSGSGVLGDPTRAGSSEGRALFDRLVGQTLAAHDNLARRRVAGN